MQSMEAILRCLLLEESTQDSIVSFRLTIICTNQIHVYCTMQLQHPGWRRSGQRKQTIVSKDFFLGDACCTSNKRAQKSKNNNDNKLTRKWCPWMWCSLKWQKPSNWGFSYIRTMEEKNVRCAVLFNCSAGTVIFYSIGGVNDECLLISCHDCSSLISLG